MTVITRNDYTRRATARSGPRPLTWFGGPFLGRSLFTPTIAAVALYAAGCAANRWIGHPPAMHHYGNVLVDYLHSWQLWAWIGGVIFTLLCGFVGLLTCGVPDGEHYSDWIRAYMVTAGLVVGAWLTWATLASPYGRGAWITAGASATFFTVLWPFARRAQIHHEAEFRARRSAPGVAGGPARRPLTEADKFLAQFTKAGCPADEVTHEDGTVEKVSRLRWFGKYPTGAGFVLHLGLPADGSLTVDRLAAMKAQLEIIFAQTFRDGMRAGAINFRRATNNAGQVLPDEVYLEFDLLDVLAEAAVMPDEHDELDVYSLIPVGRFADGETLYLTIAEIHAMVVMLTGEGKSNLLHVLLYMVSRCRNALIWMADLKGAETLGAWLEAYRRRDTCPATGKPVKPVIDWAAADRFEAERMFLAAVELGKNRPHIRRMNGGAGKWMATPAEPAVLIVGEEISEVVGDHVGPAYTNEADGATSKHLANLATRGVILSRSAAAWWWLVGQRGTVDIFGSGTAMSQLKLRICGRVEGMQDARDVFKNANNGHRAAEMVQELTHPGEVVVLGGGHNDPRKARVFFMGDDAELANRIRTAAIKHSHLRPQLDAASAKVIEQFGYSTRWTDPDRTAWLYTGVPSPNARRWTPQTSAPAGDTAAPVTRPEGRSAVEMLGLGDKMTADPFARPAAASTPAPANDGAPLDVDDAAAWDELERLYGDEMAAAAAAVQGGDQEPEQHRPAVTIEPRPYQEWVKIIDEAGSQGITRMNSYRELVRRLGKVPVPNRTIVYDFLDKARSDRSLGDRMIVCPTEGRNALVYTRRHFNQ